MTNEKSQFQQAKASACLRALFGDDICKGDRVEIDGDEEPSGRFGFTLVGEDGEAKRCGVSPAVVHVVVNEEALRDAEADNKRLRDEILKLKFGPDSPIRERDRLRAAIDRFEKELQRELDDGCLACTPDMPCQACLQTARILGSFQGILKLEKKDSADVDQY